MNQSSLPFRLWIVLISAICSLVFVIRITGPSDLESYAQVLNVGYILDLVTQGHWLVQYDLESAIMSRPPAHTWLMAPFVALFGLDRLALTLPSFLSILTLALLVLEVGRRRFGQLAGGLAGLAIVLAPSMAKQVALVRPDPVFMVTVAVASLAAFFAWDRERGRGTQRCWLFFWFMAAVTTLINGPLGLLLAAGGLLSYLWERRDNPQTPPLSGPHLAGLLLFFALTLGWFAAAWMSEGQALINKMLFAELIGHAVGEHRGGWQASDLLKPTLFLLIRYLPFSLPFFFSIWRVFRHPAANPGERRFERFLTCWALFGLLILSLVKDQRADHLLPLWPACALLAGREMAFFARRIGETRFAGISLILGVVLLGATYAAVQAPTGALGKQATNSDYARELKLASDAQSAANAFKEEGLDATQLLHIDTPITLQLYLGTYRPFISQAQLVQHLSESDEPVDLALGKMDINDLNLSRADYLIEQRFRWPADDSLAPALQAYRISRQN